MMPQRMCVLLNTKTVIAFDQIKINVDVAFTVKSIYHIVGCMDRAFNAAFSLIMLHYHNSAVQAFP
jgi:hypothetical protein